MRIQNYRTNGIDLYNKQVEKNQPKSEVKQKEDKLEISKEAQALQKSKEMIQQRQEKVQRIEQQVQSGTYSINAKEIAKSMIDFFRKQ